MKKIIALQGTYDSGKTTTIRLLPAILLANGYTHVSGTIPVAGDFSAIFAKEEIKIGVTSAGDRRDDVLGALNYFINAGCEVCVCACRTYDRNPPGTVAAVNSFPAYSAQFLPKTPAPTTAQQAIVNAADAQTIFSLI